MKSNSVSFRIKNKKGELVTVVGEFEVGVESSHLFRGGNLIYCSVCAKDSSDAVPLLLQYENIFCERCGNSAVDIHFSENDDDVYLEYFGTDLNTFQELYSLSTLLPYSDWNSVADYFIKFEKNDIDLGYPVDYKGWVTSNPVLVEEKLDIPYHLRISNRNIDKSVNISTALQSKLDNNERDILFEDTVDRLHEVFSVVETPYGEFDLFSNGNVVVQNPLFPQNNYGNGECWVVCDDSLWYVRNNYRSGDNLKFNNVLIDGELKAIGKMIAFDSDVYDLIMLLKNEQK